MTEADKYEVVKLKRMWMTHREVIEYLEQRNIEISRGQISKIMKVWRETDKVSTGKKRQVGQASFLMAIEDTFT